MSTVPAWQKREHERQLLLDEMSIQMIERALNPVDEKDLEGEDFFYALTAIVLRHLELKGETHTSSDKRNKMFGTEVRRGHFEAHMFFEEHVRSQIFMFGRSEEEKLALLAQFLEKYVMPSLTADLHQNLSLQEYTDPKLIFHSKRMEEVRMEDEQSGYTITEKKSSSGEYYPEGLDEIEK